MSETSLSIFYLRCAGAAAVTGTLPLADIPAWEIRRQEVKPSGGRVGIELVEQVLATGLTLPAAWSAISAIVAASTATSHDQPVVTTLGASPRQQGGEST